MDEVDVAPDGTVRPVAKEKGERGDGRQGGMGRREAKWEGEKEKRRKGWRRRRRRVRVAREKKIAAQHHEKRRVVRVVLVA